MPKLEARPEDADKARECRALHTLREMRTGSRTGELWSKLQSGSKLPPSKRFALAGGTKGKSGIVGLFMSVRYVPERNLAGSGKKPAAVRRC